MQKIIRGIHEFQENYFAGQQELFERLAAGQNPETLFITCSDSRINPNLLTQTEPGELFILRNAGNIVPPWGAANGGEGATIEYAVRVLEVRRAVLAAWLDHPPASYRSNGLKATEETPDRWCMSHLRNIDHTVYHLPHALGGREAVEAVLDQLPDRSHLMQYRIDETACFASKGDAQSWLHKQKFVPPTDTTIAAYLDNVSAWLVGEEG